MGTTPTFGLRYPEATDPADVPTDLHELALDVEGRLVADDVRLDALEAGTGFPGSELDYVEFTSSVTVNTTTEAAPTLIVATTAAKSYPAGPVWIEFYCPSARPDTGAVGRSLNIILRDITSGVVVKGALAVLLTPAAGGANQAVSARRKLYGADAISAGVHQWDIRAFGSATGGLVRAGLGGAGNDVPGFVRVVKA